MDGKGLPDKPVIITFDDGYENLAEYAFPVLQRYGFSATVFVVTGNLGGSNAWDEVRGSATLRLLSADQITEWAAKGIEFGSHTRSHPDLRTLAIEDAQHEISGSKRDLEEVLGSPVASFAYPYGFRNDAAEAGVRHFYDWRSALLQIRRASIAWEQILTNYSARWCSRMIRLWIWHCEWPSVPAQWHGCVRR